MVRQGPREWRPGLSPTSGAWHGPKSRGVLRPGLLPDLMHSAGDALQEAGQPVQRDTPKITYFRLQLLGQCGTRRLARPPPRLGHASAAERGAESGPELCEAFMRRHPVTRGAIAVRGGVHLAEPIGSRRESVRSLMFVEVGAGADRSRGALLAGSRQRCTVRASQRDSRQRSHPAGCRTLLSRCQFWRPSGSWSIAHVRSAKLHPEAVNGPSRASLAPGADMSSARPGDTE